MSFEKAIGQLKESLVHTNSHSARQDPGLARQFRAASIQAFEFTYELAYKTLKRYLEHTEPNPALFEK
ncbi:MAG: nucleotidyltransferase substrate binding protein [Candidatus Caenarcaniphilales bacterium]|nr:nucleotidyltransferase substrate binding protein [Candidatus Caenarcaniphilales bacterium]